MVLLVLMITKLKKGQIMTTQNQFPENDDQFQEHEITKVELSEDGTFYMVTMDDSFGFAIPKTKDIDVNPGDTLRTYGKGFGYRVRGIFINGHKVSYYTEAEFEVKRLRDTYGESCKDWLERWDKGDLVWSVSMGGMGPGYEQCIQIMVAEMLRYLVRKDTCLEELMDDDLAEFNTEFEHWAEQADFIKKLGPSGAQYGAAKNLAFILWRKGPVEALTDSVVEKRLIMVSKDFPSYEPETDET